MLPGNGRHRRPRQAPALVVAAGVTGSAIAIPLLGAASAHATDAVTWDRLADCESNGSWDAAPGNGHFGGLQLTQDEWVTHGGLDYALSANKASRSQQIIIAEKVLADEGPGAWPGCAVLVGLTPSGSPTPSASPSDSASPTPSGGSTTGSGGSSGPSSAASTSPEPSTTPSGTSQDEGGKPDDSGAGDSASAGSASGRHRGGQAGEGSGRDGADDSAGRHASRGGSAGKGRDTADGVYTVRPGDNLWAIAEAHDLDGGWPALYAANKKTVGDDPDLILPGQRLDLS